MQTDMKLENVYNLSVDELTEQLSTDAASGL